MNLNALSNSVLMSSLEKNENPIFLKNYALRKILNMFTNKIYQAPSKSGTESQSISEEIKIEICNIFYFVLDLRLEYLIENYITCFKREVSPNFASVMTKQDFNSLLKTGMPEKNLEAGEAYLQGKDVRITVFKNYTSLPEFRSFDTILNRSFMEVVLISLYFANSSALQDMSLKVVSNDQLLEKYSSQSRKLVNELEHTLMLFSHEDIEIYNKLSVNYRSLCQYENLCQVWYLIIKKTLFEKEYQVAMNQVFFTE